MSGPLLIILFEDYLRSQNLLDAKLSAKEVVYIATVKHDDLHIMENFVNQLNQKLQVSSAKINHNLIFDQQILIEQLQKLYGVTDNGE